MLALPPPPPSLAASHCDLGLLGAPLGLMAASAQSPRAQPLPPTRPAGPARQGIDLRQREKELGARAEQRKAQENEAQLRREIESLGEDRRKFNQQIIEPRPASSAWRSELRRPRRDRPARRPRAGAADIAGQRRDVIAEVLAALQRIGRQAPPGDLLGAEDALQSCARP